MIVCSVFCLWIQWSTCSGTPPPPLSSIMCNKTIESVYFNFKFKPVLFVLMVILCVLLFMFALLLFICHHCPSSSWWLHFPLWFDFKFHSALTVYHFWLFGKPLIGTICSLYIPVLIIFKVCLDTEIIIGANKSLCILLFLFWKVNIDEALSVGLLCLSLCLSLASDALETIQVIIIS